MYLSKEKLNEIKKKYRTIIITDGDDVDALYFACDVMKAEADELEEKCPYATNTIDRIERAIHELYEISRDIENENFSEAEDEE